jgi:hypothetical protein
LVVISVIQQSVFELSFGFNKLKIMSRYASHGGSHAVATNMLQNIAAQKESYKEPIRENHSMCKQLAERIQYIEATLEELGVLSKENQTNTSTTASSMSEEEIRAILQDHKNQLKELAKRNVQGERQVDSFVNAIQTVRQHIVNNHTSTASSSPNEENHPDTEIPDYQEQITQAMNANNQHNNALLPLEIQQESMYREVCEAIGERSSNAAAAAVDEDIEIVPDRPGALTAASASSSAANAHVKCPVTNAYMHDAVQNTVCGHIYSRTGMEALILQQSQSRRGGQCACPIPGCTNRNVTVQQLRDDKTTQMRVRKAQRRQAQLQEIQASQASNLVDTDEEEEKD